MIAALSVFVIAEADHCPSPGHANTVSVRTAPPRRPPNARPITVVVGMRAFRRACFLMTTRSSSPFDRAVLMYSWFRTSSMLERIIRVITAIVPKARVIEGRARCQSASPRPCQLCARMASIV